MQQAVSTSGQQAGWEKREYILILQRPLYIPGQFSCNVFYITILIILQNKAVVVCGAQKKEEGFWCHSEELCYTVCGSIGSALLFYTTQAQKEALPVQKSSSQNKWEVSSAYFDFSWSVCLCHHQEEKFRTWSEGWCSGNPESRHSPSHLRGFLR